MKIRVFLFSLCISFGTTYTCAQVLTRYYPNGDAIEIVLNKDTIGIGGIDDILPEKLKTMRKMYRMEPFEVTKFIEEDKKLEGCDVPYRFGKGFETSYTLNDGIWTKTEKGRIWEITFRSEGALTLNFIFRNFHLANGSCLYILNEENTMIYGPVTSSLTTRVGSFLTDLVSGDCATILIYEPYDVEGETTLTISKVVHGYRSFSVNMANGSYRGRQPAVRSVLLHWSGT